MPRAAWTTTPLLDLEAEMLVYDLVRHLNDVHAFEPEMAGSGQQARAIREDFFQAVHTPEFGVRSGECGEGGALKTLRMPE